MIFKIDEYLLTIELDPFQLTISKADGQHLQTAENHPAASTCTQNKNGLVITFPECNLHIESRGGGLLLRTTPQTESFSLSFDLSGYWYGHGELLNQGYPLNQIMLPQSTLLTYDNGPDGHGCKLTPAWYSSEGALIFAYSQITTGINRPPASYPRHQWGEGPDKGPFAHRPFLDDEEKKGDGLLTLEGKELRLSIFLLSDAISAYKKLIELVGHPASIPPVELFQKPTWTTWARYKTKVSQQVVLDFANQIIREGYPYNVMEIDDRWQTHYGDICFDPQRFPDPKAMVETLHAQGFKVTAWVIPFLDPDSAAFSEGAESGYLVRNRQGQPYLVPWWQGTGGLLDVTNTAALDWFQTRLEKLQRETSLDGYKFDAGEAIYLPEDAVCAKSIQRNDYTHYYIEFIGKNFRLCEARSAWFNQNEPIFLRQWDKASTWGLDNGLHSVLTAALSLSLTGYPFILPDMVGGNAYEETPNAEIMIRWAQLNALLPAVQFSLAPWDYGDQCNSICRRYAELHLEYSGRFLELADETTRTGAPIIRPVWWLAPNSEKALTCNDEFLLGNNILVAPIVKEGATSRDIYLPPGQWRDHWSGAIHEGEMVIRDFPAELEVLPFFELQA